MPLIGGPYCSLEAPSEGGSQERLEAPSKGGPQERLGPQWFFQRSIRGSSVSNLICIAVIVTHNRLSPYK